MMKTKFIFITVFLILISCTESVVDIQNGKEIKLIEPNGGENFLFSDTINIKWEYKNIEGFNIYFSKDNGKDWLSITENIKNSSEFNYIPIDTLKSENCLIKIQDSSDDRVYDISDSVFFLKPYQDTNIIDLSYFEYFKFNKGNIWVDSVHKINYSDFEDLRYAEKSEDMGLVEINGQLYHKIAKTNSLGEEKQKYFRIDSTTGYLYQGFDQYNIQRFETDIDLESGNHIVYLSEYNRRWITVSEESDNLFGFDINILKHQISDSELDWTYKFSKKYGIIYYKAPAYMGFEDYKLKGCVINSVVFGDTSMVSYNPVLESLKLYPLEIGRFWNFSYEEEIDDSLVKSSFYRRNVEKDTIINNKQYYKIISTIDDSTYKKIEFERIDSANAYVYRYNNKTESDILVEKLFVKDFSSWDNTYRFYNENATKNENWIEKPYYFERISYENNNECPSETYVYSLVENIGLSEVTILGCNKNVHIKLLE